MRTKQISIAFCFPYRSIGGVSILFLRLAKLLSVCHRITIIDYEDGYMASRIPKNVSFLPLHKVNELSSDSIVIFQSTPAWRMEAIELFPNSCKIFFWNLHPRNIYGPLLPNVSKTTMRKFINCFSAARIDKLYRYVSWLVANQSIGFMDSENLIATERTLGTKFVGAHMFPIITDGPLTEFHSGAARKSGSDDLNAIWIGRLESFKTHALEKLIRDLSRVEGRAINLTIVGEGEDKSKLKSLAIKLAYQLKITFVGELSGSSLAKEITKSDVGFCMGTSALDVAKYQVPVVCLDYSFESINYPISYQFLCDVEGYTLARELDRSLVLKGRQLSELLDEVIRDKESIASQCEDYWSKNHSPSTVEHFVDRILSSKATVGELKRKRFHKAPVLVLLINYLLYLRETRGVQTDVYKI